MLCALRRRFPTAFIAWVTQPAVAELLRNHPALDRLFVVRRRWLQSPRAMRQLRGQLRSLQWDITIDPQSLTKSATAAWLSAAPWRVGFAPPQGRELSLLINNVRVEPTANHVIDRYLELLEPLGIQWPSVEFGIPQDGATRGFVDTWLAHAELTGGFAVLNPGAHWHSKRWPVERYARVAEYLQWQHGLRSVVTWGSEQERIWADRIVQQSGGSAVRSFGTTLSELAELARAARLFVGSDTGPLHLAAAVGTPCVGLYGPSQPRVCGPYGVGHLALQDYYQSGSVRQRRRADNDALRAIGVATVCSACDQILARPQTRAHAVDAFAPGRYAPDHHCCQTS
jgi:ADP-heptose:LPS heptosyltransferase